MFLAAPAGAADAVGTPGEVREITAVVLDISGEVESIDAHIDDQGRDALNPDLSRRRAESVAAVLGPLVAAGDITLVTQGLGEDHPRVANQDADGNPMPENQRRNRRVEIATT